MEISVNVECLSNEDQIAILTELADNMDSSDMVEGLGTANISNIINALRPLPLDEVIEGFDDFTLSAVKDYSLNEIDCADFINDTDIQEMQHFVDNLSDDTRKELFKMLDIKVNPNA